MSKKVSWCIWKKREVTLDLIMKTGKSIPKKKNYRTTTSKLKACKQQNKPVIFQKVRCKFLLLPGRFRVLWCDPVLCHLPHAQLFLGMAKCVFKYWVAKGHLNSKQLQEIEAQPRQWKSRPTLGDYQKNIFKIWFVRCWTVEKLDSDLLSFDFEGNYWWQAS